MTIEQFIKQTYKQTKAEFEELQTNDVSYDEKRLYLYIQTTKSIAAMLNIDDYELAVKQWTRALELLLINCRLYNVIPRTELLEQGFGFPKVDIYKEDQMIMCFLEGYLLCQQPKLDVIGWIEAGRELELVILERNE